MKLDRYGIQPDGSVVLPGWQFSRAQPDPPGTAHIVARNTVPNEHGRAVDYRVQESRRGNAWWLSASYGDMRASNTLRTGLARVAEAWCAAVEAGRVSVARLASRLRQ